jgi:hypothetical protein
MDDETLFFCNGINAETGDYLVPPMTASQLAALARQQPPAPQEVQWLRGWLDKTRNGRDVRDGIDVRDLSQTGWGVIFAAEDPQAKEIRKELGPLLSHRRAMAGPYYREYIGKEGYQPGEGLEGFLTRQKTDVGEPADPEKLPYYLLLVGSPELIPYSFQQALDVTYAVGRIHFPTMAEFRSYAESVVTAESATPTPKRQAIFFGPSHPEDEPTRRSVDDLLRPLAQKMGSRKNGWEVSPVLEEAATKQRLATFLGGGETPGFLFTAGHGVGFSFGGPSQPVKNGALVCHGWQGPKSGPIGSEHYFTAGEVNGDAGVLGLVGFFFACYSGGTPADDDFSLASPGERAALAPKPFVAPLAQRLLGHPKGGALAIIGHVDRVWQTSFYSPRVGPTLQTFEDALLRLLNGYPLGSAMELFGRRYANLSTQLAKSLQASFRRDGDDVNLAEKWTASNDVGKYVVIGDPAVRIKPPARPPGEDERKDVPRGDARAKGGALLY